MPCEQQAWRRSGGGPGACAGCSGVSTSVAPLSPAFPAACRPLTLPQGLPTIRAYGAGARFRASFLWDLSENGAW